MDVAQQVLSTTSEVWNCHYTLLRDRRGLKYNERWNLYHCYFQQQKLWKVGCATSETNDRPTLEVSSKDALKGVLTLVRANTRYSPVSICNPETQTWHFQGWILGGRVAAVTQSQSTSPLGVLPLLHSRFLDCPWKQRHWLLAWAEGHVDVVGLLHIPVAAHSPRPCPFLRTGSFLAGSVPTNSVPVQGA